jgi:hypothetical protein
LAGKRKFVLVHACNHADTDDGLPFSCDCQKYITADEAEQDIAAGLVVYKKFQKHSGGFVLNRREVVSCGRQPMVPRAPTIDQAHIERAYVGTVDHPSGSKAEQRRIELYGELTQQCFVELGAVERPRGMLTPPTEYTPPQPGECSSDPGYSP